MRRLRSLRNLSHTVVALSLCVLSLVACGQETPSITEPTTPNSEQKEQGKDSPRVRMFNKAYKTFTADAVENLVYDLDNVGEVERTLGKGKVTGSSSITVQPIALPGRSYSAEFVCKQEQPSKVRLSFFSGDRDLGISLYVEECSASLQALGSPDSSEIDAADRLVIEAQSDTTVIAVVVQKHQIV